MEDQFIAYGKGDYSIPMTINDVITIKIEGVFCPPEKLKRDVLFVVDVTGSMGTSVSSSPPSTDENHDPSSGGECGRSRAVEKAIASFPDNGEVKFAVITFSDEVVKKSSAFYDTESQLFSGDDLALSDLCDALGGTNYDAPLQESLNLFQKGRADATKEIYFISDGEPNMGDGKDIAKKLKETGVPIGGSTIPVTIATLMLQGNDQVLRDFIASHDQDNQPLHARVENVSELEIVLANLAFNKIMRGEMRYRPIGSTADFTTVRLDRCDENPLFSVPPMEFSIDTAPEGFELFYTYWDRLTHEYKNAGTLNWTP